MVEVNSLIGGEGNGGVMLTDVHIGRGLKLFWILGFFFKKKIDITDAVVSVALTLQHLALSGKSLLDLKLILPQYEIVKLKVRRRKKIIHSLTHSLTH